MQTDKTHQHFFNHQAETWNSNDDRKKIESLEKIFQQLNAGVQELVLDLGCGTGILATVLIEYLSEKGRIIEFDFSLEMLRQNKQRHHPDDQRLLWLSGDAHHLPFTSEQFTFLACFAVLPHLSHGTRLWRVGLLQLINLALYSGARSIPTLIKGRSIFTIRLTNMPGKWTGFL